MNNKGNAFDVFYIGLTCFIGALSILLIATIYGQVSPMLTENIQSTEGQNAITQGTAAYLVFDYGYLGLFVGLVLFILFSASQVRTHPLYLVVSICLLVLFLIITPQFTNAYEKFVSDSHIATTVISYPIIDYIMDNLPTLITIIGFVVLIILYGKSGNGGAGY